MTYKKYHLIRTICSGIIFALLVFAVSMLIAFINNGGEITIEKLVPIIIVAGVAFLVFAIIFGRLFCGFLCPLGLLFDVVWKITELLHLPKLKRDEKFMKVINILNKVFLGFFICGILALIVILIFAPEILSGVSIPIFVPIIAASVMIILNSLARRFFCNVCPIGSFIGIFKKASIAKLEKECGDCLLCGACYEACPMRIKEIYTQVNDKDVSNSQCIYCGECIKKCQSDNALSITMCGKKIYTSSEKDFIENQFSGIATKNKREKL